MSSAGCYTHLVTVSLHHSVPLQGSEAREGTDHRRRIQIMAPCDRFDVHGEVAHHSFDQIRSQAIVIGEAIAFHGRKLSRADASRIFSEANRVLDVALGQSPDRG